jgi:hypothetical protein
MKTFPQSTAAELARTLMCALCWASAGTACQRHPAGDHLNRYEDAERRGVLGRQLLAGIVARLDPAGPHVIVPDRRSCPRGHAADLMTAAEFEDWSADPADGLDDDDEDVSR